MNHRTINLTDKKGDEMNRKHLRTCHDCGAAPGELHGACCDVEPCPYCGRQLLTCDHWFKTPREGDRIPWTGEWPGTAECKEFGWFARPGAKGWESCDPSHPQAWPDLGRLHLEATWDRKGKRWIRAKRKARKR